MPYDLTYLFKQPTSFIQFLAVLQALLCIPKGTRCRLYVPDLGHLVLVSPKQLWGGCQLPRLRAKVVIVCRVGITHSTFQQDLPKCKPRCKHPGSPGCINMRILGALKKCAEMRLKCVMKCSILDLATSATGALCIRCIRPLMQKCADNAAQMHTHAHKMRTKCVRKTPTKSSQKPTHTLLDCE